MTNKKFWLGMLAIVLVFGMTVAGCDDGSDNGSDNKETKPSPPTGLTGKCVAPNNSIQLTWNPVNRADEYWVQYKKGSDSNYGLTEKTKTTSYTFTDLDYATQYDFQVAVRNTDGLSSNYSSPISVETGNPLTGSVSLSMETIHNLKISFYDIRIKFTLSDGAWWENVDTITKDIFASWVTMTGTPNVSGWNITRFDYSLDRRPQTIQFSFNSENSGISISGLTATLDTTKLTQMKSYTNITNTLSAGSPSTVSSSAWNEE